MPTFFYRGFIQSGEATSGTIQASSKRTAGKHLAAQGIIVATSDISLAANGSKRDQPRNYRLLIVLFAAGACVSVFGLWQLLGPSSWMRVTGRSLGWEIVETPTAYQLQVSYEYLVAGTMHVGRDVVFDAWENDGRFEVANAATVDYHEGALIDVYHRPGNPKDSVIRRSLFQNATVLLTAGSALLALGMIVLFRRIDEEAAEDS